MSNHALAIVPAQPVALADEWTDERKEFVRRQYCGGAPEDVADLFLLLCQRRGLSPEDRQVNLIKRAGKWNTEPTIDGFRVIAARSGAYAGTDPPVWEGSGTLNNGRRHPTKATVTVYRIVQGVRCPFAATVLWDEFNAGQNNWLTMPAHMLAKVAETHALRKAFPVETSGLYTDAEMEQAGNAVEVRAVTVREAPQAAQGRESEQPASSTANARPAGSGRATEETAGITEKQRNYILFMLEGKDGTGGPIADEDGRHLLTASRFDGRVSLNDLTQQEASDFIEFIKDTDRAQLRAFVGELKREAAKRRGQTELPIEPPELGSPEDLAEIERIAASSHDAATGAHPDWTETQLRWKEAIDQAMTARQFDAIGASIPKDRHGNPDAMLADYLAVKREQQGK